LTATPLQMASGFAVFANGGFRIEPYFITRIEDMSGKVVYEASPVIACAACGQPAAAPPATVESEVATVVIGDEESDAYGNEEGALPGGGPAPFSPAVMAAAVNGDPAQQAFVAGPPLLGM